MQTDTQHSLLLSHTHPPDHTCTPRPLCSHSPTFLHWGWGHLPQAPCAGPGLELAVSPCELRMGSQAGFVTLLGGHVGGVGMSLVMDVRRDKPSSTVALGVSSLQLDLVSLRHEGRCLSCLQHAHVHGDSQRHTAICTVRLMLVRTCAETHACPHTERVLILHADPISHGCASWVLTQGSTCTHVTHILTHVD